MRVKWLETLRSMDVSQFIACVVLHKSHCLRIDSEQHHGGSCLQNQRWRGGYTVQNSISSNCGSLVIDLM